MTDAAGQRTNARAGGGGLADGARVAGLVAFALDCAFVSCAQSIRVAVKNTGIVLPSMIKWPSAFECNPQFMIRGRPAPGYVIGAAGIAGRGLADHRNQREFRDLEERPRAAGG